MEKAIIHSPNMEMRRSLASAESTRHSEGMRSETDTELRLEVVELAHHICFQRWLISI